MDLSSYITYLCAAHEPEMAHKEVNKQIVELHGKVIELEKLRKAHWEAWTRASKPMSGYVLWVHQHMGGGYIDSDSIESVYTYNQLEEHCKESLGLTDNAFKILLLDGVVDLNEVTSTIFDYSVDHSLWSVFIDVHPEGEEIPE